MAGSISLMTRLSAMELVSGLTDKLSRLTSANLVFDNHLILYVCEIVIPLGGQRSCRGRHHIYQRSYKKDMALDINE